MPSSAWRVTGVQTDRKSTRLNSSHTLISYAVFCLKKKNQTGRDGNSLMFGSLRHPRRWSHDPLCCPLASVWPSRHAVSPFFLPPSFLFFFNDTAPTEISPLPLHDALPINDTATTEIYTLSLHDALPISVVAVS